MEYNSINVTFAKDGDALKLVKFEKKQNDGIIIPEDAPSLGTFDGNKFTKRVDGLDLKTAIKTASARKPPVVAVDLEDEESDDELPSPEPSPREEGSDDDEAESVEDFDDEDAVPNAIVNWRKHFEIVYPERNEKRGKAARRILASADKKELIEALKEYALLSKDGEYTYNKGNINPTQEGVDNANAELTKAKDKWNNYNYIKHEHATGKLAGIIDSIQDSQTIEELITALKLYQDDARPGEYKYDEKGDNLLPPSTTTWGAIKRVAKTNGVLSLFDKQNGKKGGKKTRRNMKYKLKRTQNKRANKRRTKKYYR